MARVSVIIPFHKYEQFLLDCLKSLDEQQFRDFEVILVLDGYEGDISHLTSQFGDSMDIHVFRTEGSTGVAAARNLGLQKAVGEFVYFLDSDDYIYKDAIAELLEAVDTEGADIVYGKRNKSYYKRDIFLPIFDETLERKATEAAALGEGAGDEAGEESSEEDNDDDDQFESEEAQNAFEEAQVEHRRKRAARFLIKEKKGFGQVSVLGILIRREVLSQNELCFDEKYRFFSDVPFLARLLDLDVNIRKRYASRYIKRTHNDPVNYPALSQEKDPGKFFEMADAVEDAMKSVRPGGDVKNALDFLTINYASRRFSPRIRRNLSDEWKGKKFKKMQELLGFIDPDYLKKRKHFKKVLCKAIMSGDVERARKAVTRRLAIKKIKKVFTGKHQIARYLYRNRYLKKPIKKNYVMFETFFGKSYADSPKYVYEYLAKNYPDQFEFVWVLDNKTKLPYKGKKVKRFSRQYMYYLATCNYFVFNVKQPNWFVKREGVTFLETWHGTPLKKLCFDLEEVFSASPMYKENTFKKSREWDYLIAANEFSSKTFRRCYKFDNTMLEYGYPRNDILHDENRDELEKHFRSKLGIPEGKKTILYAPTWRDDEYYGSGQYKFTLKLDLDLMREKLGDEYVVLLRTHYYIADALDLGAYEGFAMNFSKYDDISELYLISDIIITDYSSVFFDYANLRRPMLFFTYDLEKYRDVLRGFYIDIEEELPGPLLYTTEEVIDAVKDIDSVTERYKEKYEIFYDRYCGWEDGHAAENVAKQVFKL